jgi:hypothetical protein
MSQNIRYGLPGLVGFSVLTLGNIVSTTFLIWFAANGRAVWVVFPFCVGAWGSYLCSHYLVEGHFIDQTEPGDESDTDSDSDTDTDSDSDSDSSGALPTSWTHRTLAAVGVVSMFLTFPTGILAVQNDNLGLLFVSATFFVVGYIVGHQGFTKKPL